VVLKEGTYAIEDFYIARYPVTYRQYRAFLQAEDGFHNSEWWEGLAADSHHKATPGEQNRPTDNHPAENVSWYDAIAFCRWLNVRLGIPQLPTKLAIKKGLLYGTTLLQDYQGIRLPTEWEWQYAATGDNPGYDYPWGQEWDNTKANTYESGLSRTTAVGMCPEGAAPCGALDMSGNVFDWCLNEYDPYKIMEKVSLNGDARRVVRGGSWRDDQRLARADLHSYGNSDARHYDHGFRLVMSLPGS
jgi:formylglycine-generating enzyme required for sulfatase activity